MAGELAPHLTQVTVERFIDFLNPSTPAVGNTGGARVYYDGTQLAVSEEGGTADKLPQLALANAFTNRQTTTDGVSSGTARVVGGRCNAFTADGTALTGSNVETVLASYSIPANTLKPGVRLRVKAMIDVTAETSTTTLIPRLRLGATTLTGTALVTGATVDVAANNIWVVEFDLIAQGALGATAACRGWGKYQDLAAAGGAFKSAALGTGGSGATFATNGILLLELTGIWSASDANSCVCTYFDVEIV